MIDKLKVPISDELIKFEFPDYQTLNLSKTIKLYLLNDNSLNLTSVKFVIKNGANDDLIAGTSYLTSQMMMRGTSGFTAEQLAEKIETLGTSIKSSAQADDFVLSSICLSEYFPQILGYMCDVLFDSVFPDDEFVKLKKKHISTIMQEITDINYLSSVAFNRSIYEGGYSNPLLGTKSSVQSIERNQVYERYQYLINNSKVSIIIVGNFDSDKTIKYINERFHHLYDSDNEQKKIEVKIKKKIISAIDKESSNQASLKLGRKMIERQNPDFPYAQIVNIIYGGFFLSRLNKILREEKGFTYGVQSMIDNRKNATIQMIASNLKIDKTAESIKIILSENHKLKDEPITDDELRRAVRYILGSFLRSLETPQQIASLIQSLDMYDLGKDFYKDYYYQTSMVTIGNINSTIEKYFLNDDFVISAAGDLKVIQNQLAEFGKVNIIEID